MKVLKSLLLALFLLGTGCAPLSAPSPLTVAAAADLQFAFAEMGALFQQETGQRVTFVFGSSGHLAQQIANGAPVDAFAAANVRYIDELTAQGRTIADTQQVYALGRIVLASRKGAGLPLGELSDLARPEVKRIAIANPEHAPYGLAAKEALTAVGIWEKVRPKLVYGESVRQALQFVQTGNAEAGLVALSIAGVPEITYSLVDERLHAPIQQSMAVVRGTKQEGAARRFLELVNGPRGRSIMQKYGFTVPVG